MMGNGVVGGVFPDELELVGIIVLSLVAAITGMLMINDKSAEYLKRHFVWEAVVGSTFLVSVFFILGEFTEMWIAAIIALVTAYCLDKKNSA